MSKIRFDYEAIARIVHELNRLYCESTGDFSQPTWEGAPDWQKKSIREGVKNVIWHPDITPEQSHISWMQHKLADGWKYGPLKDVTLKEHPCLVPYDQLPIEQKAKDELFINTVMALAPLVGSTFEDGINA